MKRVGLPEDIAHAIVFLTSDESKFITGHEMIIDGGILSWTGIPLTKKNTSTKK